MMPNMKRILSTSNMIQEGNNYMSNQAEFNQLSTNQVLSNAAVISDRQNYNGEPVIISSNGLSNFNNGGYSNNSDSVAMDYYRFKEQRVVKKPQSNIASSVNLDRPKISYTQMIIMALESSPQKALTVNEIYSWIEKNYPFFGGVSTGWKNSLRHNLSINKCFKKIIKTGQMGRGSYWIIDPSKREELVENFFRNVQVPSMQPVIIPAQNMPDNLTQIVYVNDNQINNHQLSFQIAQNPNNVINNTPINKPVTPQISLTFQNPSPQISVTQSTNNYSSNDVKPKHERLPRKSQIQTIDCRKSFKQESPEQLYRKFDWNLETDGAPEILSEKHSDSWTDTRFTKTMCYTNNSDLDSDTSETDCNDTCRAIQSSILFYPLKQHTKRFDSLVITTPLLHHEYAFDNRSILELEQLPPEILIRHSFPPSRRSDTSLSIDDNSHNDDVDADNDDVYNVQLEYPQSDDPNYVLDDELDGSDGSSSNYDSYKHRYEQYRQKTSFEEKKRRMLEQVKLRKPHKIMNHINYSGYDDDDSSLHPSSTNEDRPSSKKRGRPRKTMNDDSPPYKSSSRKYKKRKHKKGGGGGGGNQQSFTNHDDFDDDPIPAPSLVIDDPNDPEYSAQHPPNQIEDDEALFQPIKRNNGDKLENMYNFSTFVDTL